MKAKDILVEKVARGNFVVIKKKQQFRADPNPQHHHEEWEASWTDNISEAHPFTQREARKFMRDRASDHRTEYEARDLNFVEVEVVDGVPVIPKPEKRGVLSWLRSA